MVPVQPHDSRVVDEQGQQKCPTGMNHGNPPEREHTDDHDAAVQPQEGVLEDEPKIDDEEPKGSTTPGDPLAPPGVQRVWGIGVDVRKNMDRLVSQCISDDAGLDVIALEEQRVTSHDLAHHVGLADMKAPLSSHGHDPAGGASRPRTRDAASER